MKKVPVILDTDPGTDIDDSYATAMLLNSPELNLKLITTATGNTRYRAAVIDRLLAAAGRTDIPVAAGRLSHPEDFRYTLAQYLWEKGTEPRSSYPDAVDEIIRTVNSSEEPVTLIAIAPLTNLGDLLDRCPKIAAKINLIGMLGSVNKGCDERPGRIAEYNIVRDRTAARKVFAARWRSFRITPLDTCGAIRLTGEEFDALRNASPLMREVTDSNWHWEWWKDQIADGRTPAQTSVLFDTVAIYMALADDALVYETRHFSIAKDGKLIEDPTAPPVKAALYWRDFRAFRALLLKCLSRNLQA